MGQSKRRPRRTISSYNQIVRIDGDQGFPHFVRDWDHHDARSRIGQMETFSLNPRCRINHRGRDEIDKAFDQVRPA
jgi:hypothetical protein